MTLIFVGFVVMVQLCDAWQYGGTPGLLIPRMSQAHLCTRRDARGKRLLLNSELVLCHLCSMRKCTYAHAHRHIHDYIYI